MAKLSKGDTSTSEHHSDAWSRFERAVDVVAKSAPQHRTKEKPKASQKKRGKRGKIKAAR
jgi:hypothetical protein